MTQIRIADEVAERLATEAAFRGCDVDALASSYIESGLHADSDFELSPAQKTRLLGSIEQVRRGEVVDGDVVMARFRKTLDRIASR